MHGRFLMRRGNDSESREQCARTTQRMPPVQLHVLLDGVREREDAHERTREPTTPAPVTAPTTPRPRTRTVRMRVFNFKPLPHPHADEVTTTPRAASRSADEAT